MIVTTEGLHHALVSDIVPKPSMYRSIKEDIELKKVRYCDNFNDKTISDNDTIKRQKAERLPGGRGTRQQTAQHSVEHKARL